MSLLTEPQAWRYIARQWVTRGEENAYGTCPLIKRLHVHARISLVTRVRMEDRLHRYLQWGGHRDSHSGERIAYPVNEYTLTDGYVEAYREARALMALWLACEAEAETP